MSPGPVVPPALSDEQAATSSSGAGSQFARLASEQQVGVEPADELGRGLLLGQNQRPRLVDVGVPAVRVDAVGAPVLDAEAVEFACACVG